MTSIRPIDDSDPDPTPMSRVYDVAAHGLVHASCALVDFSEGRAGVVYSDDLKSADADHLTALCLATASRLMERQGKSSDLASQARAILSEHHLRNSVREAERVKETAERLTR